jgi:DNA-binding transcriptional regulator LsrR (DeoR family)
MRAMYKHQKELKREGLRRSRELLALMKREKLNQSELAKRQGISRQRVSKLLSRLKRT